MFKELAPEIDYYRKKAGELIKCVLAKRMLVRQALLAYPKDVLDKSVQASWHALCHLEADRELRGKDPEYAEEQDYFLANSTIQSEDMILVYKKGILYANFLQDKAAIRPMILMNKIIKITYGDGSYDNPYILEVIE